MTKLREQFERLHNYKHIDLTFKSGRYVDNTVNEEWIKFQEGK